MIGLEPHLILRTRRATEVESNKDEDSFGYVGNILFDRMVGATIHTCTPGEYGRSGSHALVQSLCEDLESCIGVEKPKKVYQIPVGGSNGLGSKCHVLLLFNYIWQICGCCSGCCCFRSKQHSLSSRNAINFSHQLFKSCFLNG